MKRFLLFSGNHYYPCGGANDFEGSFESMDAIVQQISQWKSEDNLPDWCNALDNETGKRYHVDVYRLDFKEMR